GLGLQVEPPCRLSGAPAVHRERVQVRPVLVVTEDGDPRLPGASADRVESHHPVGLRGRRPESEAAAGEPVQRPMNGPCEADDPAWWQERLLPGLWHRRLPVERSTMHRSGGSCARYARTPASAEADAGV